MHPRDHHSRNQKIISILDTKHSPRVPIEDYLRVGEWLWEIKQSTSSTREQGKLRKMMYPQLSLFSPADLSNALRLYEAMKGERDADILEVLGVDSLSNLPSSNPTVIVRTYVKSKQSQLR